MLTGGNDEHLLQKLARPRALYWFGLRKKPITTGQPLVPLSDNVHKAQVFVTYSPAGAMLATC